jgi:hypothetical protein
MQLSAADVAAIKDVILAYVIAQGGVDIASTIRSLSK